MTTSIQSAAEIQAALTAMESVRESINAIHQANAEIASSILPPGAGHPGSAIATEQQMQRVQDFSARFNEGLMNFAEYIKVLQETIVEMQAIDAENAGMITTGFGLL